jgi:hypothetical protein
LRTYVRRLPEPDLFARLDAAFAHQAALLTERQLQIVRAWQRTDRFYELAQRVARSEIDLDSLSAVELAQALDIQEALDDAVRTACLPFPLTVYRGIRSVKRTLQVDEPADAVGLTRTEEGYFATSLLREVAVEEFTARNGALFVVDVPQGINALWMAKVGSPHLRRQGELLLGEGLRTRIYACRNEGPLAVLSVEVIAL